jgi:hypothetical protein
MRMSALRCIAIAVILTAPISANAADYMTTFDHHRTLRTEHSAPRAEVEPSAQADSSWYTTSHGRFPPTTDAIFTRDPGQCNRLLCFGV